ncbi:MAG TPA: N-6 DNA methylase, partial [Aggregatilineales bacterium]|nr:N-6 DNA methylase [Aggregatilineales bacterium]
LTMRVIDPACGSGSFLIEAFDFLYRQLEPLIPNPNERREHILLHNLYGVDLDVQAVEVTRLNLLLRAAYEKRELPALTHIRHGDSLITGDDSITPKFDYQSAFEEVFADGGFDVVIGNPPYVRQETLGTKFKNYMAENYKVYEGKADLYVYFIERGLSLLKPDGRLGYIVPNKWICSGYGRKLRQYLDNFPIDRLLDFGTLKVFAEASVDVALLFLQNSSPQNEFYAVQAEDYDLHTELTDFVASREYLVARSYLRHDGWALVPNTGQSVLENLLKRGTPL